MALRHQDVQFELKAWTEWEPGHRDSTPAIMLYDLPGHRSQHSRFKKFLKGVESDGFSFIWNSPSLLRWNLHDEDLSDLRSVGVPVAPFRIFEVPSVALDFENLQDVFEEETLVAWAPDGSEFVLNLETSLTAWQEFLKPWTGKRIRIEPSFESLSDMGKFKYIVIDGMLSHVVQVRQGMEPVLTSADNRCLKQIQKSLSIFEDTPLTAEFEFVLSAERNGLLYSLNLVEPRLYLHLFPEAATAIARVIARQL